MSSRELSEWIAFARIHPLPDSYWQAGMIASATVNCWGATTTPLDFVPRSTSDDEPAQDPDHALAVFSAFAFSHNNARQSNHG